MTSGAGARKASRWLQQAAPAKTMAAAATANQFGPPGTAGAAAPAAANGRFQQCPTPDPVLNASTANPPKTFIFNQ